MDRHAGTTTRPGALERLLQRTRGVRAQPARDQQEDTTGRHMLVMLDVLNRCNLRCTMCGNASPAGTERQDMDRQAFARLAETVFPLCRQVNLSCGYEPLLARSIFDYIAVAASCGIPKLTMVSNGTLLGRARAASLVASGLPTLSISVDGATRQTYESIRIRGRFDALMDNLRGLAAARQAAHSDTPRLQFVLVLMDQTLDEAPLFVDLLSQFRPHKYLFIHHNYAPPSPERRARVEAVLRGALARCVEIGALFEEAPGFILSLDDIARAYGCPAPVTPESTAYCGDPWHFMRIAPGGDVFMCPGINEPAGNIVESAPLDVLSGPVYSRLRRQLRDGAPPPQCASCPYAGQGWVRFRREHDRLDAIVSQQLALRRQQTEAQV